MSNLLNIGKFRVRSISDGYFTLDGGGMFGILPKLVWARYVSVNRQNMAYWQTNCLLIETSKKKILVDTGLGTKLSDKELMMYGRSGPGVLLENLKKMSIHPENIDFVILTHLHMDHVGGCTARDSRNKIFSVFPKAKIILQKEEWGIATHPNALSKGSYWPENFENLDLELIEGDHDLINGLKIIITGAHTAGHQSVLLKSNGKTLFCAGDLVPTRWHVKETVVAAFDQCPHEVTSKKKGYMEKALKEDWWIHWYHDPTYPFGKVRKENGKFLAHQHSV